MLLLLLASKEKIRTSVYGAIVVPGQDLSSNELYKHSDSDTCNEKIKEYFSGNLTINWLPHVYVSLKIYDKFMFIDAYRMLQIMKKENYVY